MYNLDKIRTIPIEEVANALGIEVRHHKCNCFLHEDKHPSLTFNVSENLWHCFSCGKGGSTINLVMAKENLGFIEACRWLSEQFNIEEDINLTKQIKPMPKPRTIPSLPKVQPTNDYLPASYLSRCQSGKNTFCWSMVQSGILTADQMEEAVARYHLGATHDGGVIFWQVDEQQQVHEGKVMKYRPDGHRSQSHAPYTITSVLKRRGQLPKSHHATRCLFGLHLISKPARHEDGQPIAIVESEKTAVICSMLIPRAIWMATGGMNNLHAELFTPFQGSGYRIILFPDTDPEGKAYALWRKHAAEISSKTGLAIYTSDILERLSTPDQKERKIDLVELLLESKPSNTMDA